MGSHSTQLDASNRREPQLAEDRDKPVLGLILCVSRPSIVPEPPPAGSKAGWRLSPPKSQNLLLRQDLSEAIIQLFREEKSLDFWNWHQLLRAIQPHHQLKEIWLLGSHDETSPEGSPRDEKPAQRERPPDWHGSGRYLSRCKELLDDYKPPEAGPVQPLPLVYFEDYSEVFESLRLCAKDMRTRHRDIKPENIAVDVTGGFKVTSIAGAALTLNNEMVAQYVPTQPTKYNPKLKPLIYDVRSLGLPGH